MKELLIQKILQSNMLNARQKWVFLKYVKHSEITEYKIKKLLEMMNQEDAVIKASESAAKKNNIKKLEDYNKQLDFILKVEIPKKMKFKEQQENNFDREKEEALLQQLQNF